MKFNPMTVEELYKAMEGNRIPLRDGHSHIIILSEEHLVSSNGNNMMKLKCEANQDSAHGLMDFYIVYDTTFGLFNLKKLCDAIGCPEKYDSGDIPEGFFVHHEFDTVLKMGKASAKKLDDGTIKEYPAKLELNARYFISKVDEKDKKTKEAGLNDDLPF
jgi:hypothetical protein